MEYVAVSDVAVILLDIKSAAGKYLAALYVCPC